MSIRALNHLHARPHVPREFERPHAGSEGIRRERVSQDVGHEGIGNPCGLNCRIPAASCGGLCIRPSRPGEAGSRCEAEAHRAHRAPSE